MNTQKIYNFMIIVSVVIFTACGTDTKENSNKSTGPYSFYNATTPLKITQSVDVNGTATGGTFTISVQLLEYDFAKFAETIEMKPFDFKYGFVTNNIVTTDVNGMANFTYNLPANYDLIRGQDLVIQAVYFDPTQIIVNVPNTNPTKRSVLLTQDFLLQFR